MHLEIFSKSQGRASVDLSVPIQIVYLELCAAGTKSELRAYSLPT
jgi:hypothetical protein